MTVGKQGNPRIRLTPQAIKLLSELKTEPTFENCQTESELIIQLISEYRLGKQPSPQQTYRPPNQSVPAVEPSPSEPDEPIPCEALDAFDLALAA